MKTKNEILEEIKRVNEALTQTAKLYKHGITDEETFLRDKERYQSALDVLEWVLK